ncbi:hypothetical protein KFL_007770010 [Klebsormidium nitens]|uniref:ZFYVE26-like TPR repeats domain-containing protein n=1 Tax=Klebsormidium nitens TaxID=105231 RepID=A0A1Y1IKJ9_KLENI|nr:hypothetical protein KFL_007770010 [Klebsormidium nitens]|eukprot:GAQ91390.1 hypothetical protein KFL_007770010 [Klebsormidium nitens]
MMQMAEQGWSTQLLQRLCINYLALGQFELARGVIQELKRLDGSNAENILQAIVKESTSLRGWLASAGVPSHALLAWLARCELALSIGEESLSERGARVERALLQSIAAPLIENDRSARQREAPPDGGALKAEDQTLWQSRKGAAHDRKTEEAEGSQRAPALVPSQELLHWLLQHEPQLFKYLVQDGSSGPTSELLMQQWAQDLSGADLQAITQTIAHSVKEGDNESLKEHRVLLDRTLRLVKDQDASNALPQAQSRLWGAVVASGVEVIDELLQVAQDDLLASNSRAAASDTAGSPPLAQLRASLHTTRSTGPTTEQAAQACVGELFQHARVTRSHVLETVLQEALRAAQEQDMHKAADVLVPFPALAPLLAVMAWDLHAGSVAARQDSLQRLWHHRARAARAGHPQASPLEALCSQLAYQLHAAQTVAASSSGDGTAQADDFAANLLLARLAAGSSIQVLTDPALSVPPDLALRLVSEQPIPLSRQDAQARQHDVELLRMHLALQAVLRAIEQASAQHAQQAQAALQEAGQHMEAVSNSGKKAWLVVTLASLLQLPHAAPPLVPTQLPLRTPPADPPVPAPSLAARFVSFLQHHLPRGEAFLPSSASKAPPAPTGSTSRARDTNAARRVWARKVAAWHTRFADWLWRLQLLQRVADSQGQPAAWRDCTAALAATPAQLLDRFTRTGDLALARQVATRFALVPPETSALELAEWLEQATTTLEDGRSSRGSKDVLDLAPLQQRVSTLTALLACLDVALSAVPSSGGATRVLAQARGLAQQCRERRAAALSGSEKDVPGPDGSSKSRSAHLFRFSRKGHRRSGSGSDEERAEPGDDWAAQRVQALFHVADSLLQRLADTQSREPSVPLPALLAGTADGASNTPPSGAHAGPDVRAITALQAAIKDAHDGKRQFLSGKLHNLVKALAGRDPDTDPATPAKPKQRKTAPLPGPLSLLGLGVAPAPVGALSPSSSGGDLRLGSWGSALDGDSSTPASPLAAAALLDTGGVRASGLAALVHYVASIGDIMDEVDTTHTYNFFAILYQSPAHLLAQLAFERGSTDTASRAAELMSVDLVRQLLSSSLRPVLPPAHPAPTPGQQPAQPLEVEVAHFVARASPQQAILAARYGSLPGPGQHEGEGEAARRRGLTDVALSTAKSFPVLRRWLRLHEDVPQVPPTPLESPPPPPAAAHPSGVRFKRLRPADSPEREDAAARPAPGLPSGTLVQPEELDGRKRVSLGTKRRPSELVEWEDEAGYAAKVRELMRRGAVQDAVELADSRLVAGAPDELLLAVIEQEGTHGGQAREGGQLQAWQACTRLRDKQTAARAALRCLRRWGREQGESVLAVCAAHLPAGSALRDEVLQRKQQLARYQQVLKADPSLNTWQQVEDLFAADPEGLALRLSSKGAVGAALEVVQAAGLHPGLRHELQSRQLAHLVGGAVAQGGGPAVALRYLRELPQGEDAVAVVTGALPQLGRIKDKSLLVRYLVSHPAPGLPPPDAARLHSLAAGLAALARLPPPWQQRCGHLAEQPDLVLESLLMAQQFATAHQMLRACPSLHDDALVVRYAAKALAPPSAGAAAAPSLPASKTAAGSALPHSRAAPSDSQRTSGSPAVPRPRLERPAASSLRSISTAGGLRGVLASPDGQSTPRRISWAAGTSTMWAAASQFTRGLLHRGGEGTESPRVPSKARPAERPLTLPPSQSAAWEAMAGPADARGAALAEGAPKGRVVGDGVLTGDADKDDNTRRSHTFEAAPSAAMLKEILPLCSNVPGVVRELLAGLERTVWAAFGVPAASAATMEQGLRAADAYAQAVQHMEALLSADAAAAGDEALRSRPPSLLPQVEMVRALLRAGVPVSLPELRGETERRGLCDRLLQDERFELAHALCTKCGGPVEAVELAWGIALLATRHYSQAHAHLRAALELLPDPARLEAVQAIVAAIEGAPPVDLPHTRTLYSEVARSVALSSEEAFSFDAYLNVLNAPPEQRPPPSRRSSGEQPEAARAGGPEAPTDNRADYLDDERKDHAVQYLRQYHPSGVLPFLFRHGRFGEACHVFLAHLPPSPAPAPPTPPPQAGPAPRPTAGGGDPLVSAVGTLEELCELCVAHGAMPVLERAVAERSQAAGEDGAAQRGTVLAKMAAFCEAHRHFHHLHRIQLLLGDPVAAGLTAIQLFQNSATADEAVQHLEAARDHFDDGLALRQAAPPEGGAGGRRAKEGRKSASAKLSEEEIIKFSTRTALQAEAVRAFGDGEGPPWRHSLFGNPGDAETLRRRTAVAEQLAERNFDLAFRIIYDFRLPAVATYAGAAASLAARRRGSGVAELLRNITGTIDEGERDQVVMAAVHVYAQQHKEHPAHLVDQLSNSHRKVLACVASGRLKSAFQFASRADSAADVQLVAQQARETGQLNVMDLCHQWLAKKMQPGATE